MEKGYNVVFERTGEEGTVKGFRNWFTYKSEEDFNEKYKSCKSERVIAVGVTREKAVELCREVSLETILRESVNASTDKNGGINKSLLRMNIANSFFAFVLDTDYRELDD